MGTMHQVFISGGTGYLGRPLIARLLARGHTLRALARRGSERKLPPGIEVVLGNALDAPSFCEAVAPARTYVHLVGTPNPGPLKAAQFRSVDLASVKASADAARIARVAHFIYVSVAHPAPVMHAYQAARAEGEAYIQSLGLNATVFRPWYVLGEGHQWPRMLKPLYWLGERTPGFRDGAQRLGLVTHAQMLDALIAAVENPVLGVQVIGVPEIRMARIEPD